MPTQRDLDADGVTYRVGSTDYGLTYLIAHSRTVPFITVTVAIPNDKVADLAGLLLAAAEDFPKQDLPF